MEWPPWLVHLGAERLQRLGMGRVQMHCGDGSQELAEFDPHETLSVRDRLFIARLPDAAAYEGKKYDFFSWHGGSPAVACGRNVTREVFPQPGEACRLLPLYVQGCWKNCGLERQCAGLAPHPSFLEHRTAAARLI
jgi:hypothetical protein